MTEHVKPDTATLEQAKRMLDKWQPEEEEKALAELKETIERMPHEVLGVPVNVRSKYEQFYAAMLRRHQMMHRVKALYELEMLETMGGPVLSGFPNPLIPDGIQSGQIPCKYYDEDAHVSLEQIRGIEKIWGVRLQTTWDFCWTKAAVDEIRSAFIQVNARIGGKFKTVFGNLTFIFDTSIGYACTPTGNWIRWNPYNIKNGGERMQNVVIHELGHVLRHRTKGIPHSMTKIGSVEGTDNGETSRLPDRFEVSGIRAVGTGDIEVSETIADYFLFWVHRNFKYDALGVAAKTFMDGGWIVYTGGEIYDPGSYPLSAINIEDDSAYQSHIEVFANLLDGVIIKSPGMGYWLTNASDQNELLKKC